MQEQSSAKKRNRELFEILRNRICFLDYLPGQKLSEERLAAEFNVSRTPIRWILNRLESMELVKTIHGSGSYVTELSKQQIKDIYELRLELLDLTLHLELNPITDSFVQQLSKLLDQISKDEDQSIQAISYHFTQVYLLVMSLIKNEPLRKISEQLYYQSIRIWFALLPADELLGELNSQIIELEQLVKIAQLGDLNALFSLRKSNLSINYSKLLQWSESSDYLSK